MSRLWWQGSTSLCIQRGGQVLKGWESIRADWESIFRNTDSEEAAGEDSIRAYAARISVSSRGILYSYSVSSQPL